MTVAMDTPYVLARAASPTLLATYSSSRASMTALAQVLAGRKRRRAGCRSRSPACPRTTCEPLSRPSPGVIDPGR